MHPFATPGRSPCITEGSRMPLLMTVLEVRGSAGGDDLLSGRGASPHDSCRWAFSGLVAATLSSVLVERDRVKDSDPPPPKSLCAAPGSRLHSFTAETRAASFAWPPAASLCSLGNVYSRNR